MLIKTITKDKDLDIAIGEKVMIRVRWHRGQLKLGIDAPRELSIASLEAETERFSSPLPPRP